MSKFSVQLRNVILIGVVLLASLLVKPTSASADQLASDTNSHLAQSYSVEAEVTYIEHNYVNRGNRGMRVHITVTAHGYKGRTLNAGVYFYWADGTAMKAHSSASSSLRTNGGQLALTQKIRADYANTVWSDLWYFVPYSAFPRVNTSQDAYVKVGAGVVGSGSVNLFGRGKSFELNP